MAKISTFYEFRILDFLKTNPKATCKEIAAGSQLPLDVVRKTAKVLSDRGSVLKEQKRFPDSYGHFVTANVFWIQETKREEEE